MKHKVLEKKLLGEINSNCNEASIESIQYYINIKIAALKKAKRGLNSRY
jgi:hypothetical protein